MASELLRFMASFHRDAPAITRLTKIALDEGEGRDVPMSTTMNAATIVDHRVLPHCTQLALALAVMEVVGPDGLVWCLDHGEQRHWSSCSGVRAIDVAMRREGQTCVLR